MARLMKFKDGSKAYNVRIPAKEPERSQCIKEIHRAVEKFEIKRETASQKLNKIATKSNWLNKLGNQNK